MKFLSEENRLTERTKGNRQIKEAKSITKHNKTSVLTEKNAGEIIGNIMLTLKSSLEYHKRVFTGNLS